MSWYVYCIRLKMIYIQRSCSMIMPSQPRQGSNIMKHTSKKVQYSRTSTLGTVNTFLSPNYNYMGIKIQLHVSLSLSHWYLGLNVVLQDLCTLTYYGYWHAPITYYLYIGTNICLRHLLGYLPVPTTITEVLMCSHYICIGINTHLLPLHRY